MPLGVHTSIAGGIYRSVERAALLGCDSMQIFGRNPRSWAFTPVKEADSAIFREKRLKAGLWPVAVHTTYLINLCSPDPVIFDKSVELFKNELRTADELGAEYLVTHLGSPQDRGPGFALARISAAFREVASSGLGKKAMVLLENTAGGGYGFGSRLSDIGAIISGAEGLGVRAGLCFDTCHGFAAGYPVGHPPGVDSLIDAIEKEAGLRRLKLIHLNDSKGRPGSHLDRHEHIGRGRIGAEALRAFINHPGIAGIPLILETPKKTPEDDPMNLEIVREMMKG